MLRRVCHAILAVVMVAALVTEADARRKKTATRSQARPERTEGQSIAGGTYWRIRSKQGPVYVWIPGNYKRDTAGTVIYIHGYYTSADKAWKNHRLPQQFAKSRQNAMFIVPEAPSSNRDRVYWQNLTDLKHTVQRSGIRMPDGETVVVAHSGGFRTVQSWVDYKWLTQVILLDALYGGQGAFKSFIHTSKRAQHRKMVIVASDTAAKSRQFAREFPYAVVRDRIPTRFEEFTRREKGTRLLYIRSQYGHGSIATGGTVLPLILRLTPLERL